MLAGTCARWDRPAGHCLGTWSTWRLAVYVYVPEVPGTRVVSRTYCSLPFHQVNTDPMKSQLGYLEVVEPPSVVDSGTSQDQVLSSPH